MMELNNAVAGAVQSASVSSTDRVPGPGRAARGTLQQVTNRTVGGVVVSLSREAEAALDAAAPSGSSGATDLAGNPLAGGSLADVMVDAQERLFGAAAESVEDGVFNIYENEAQSEAQSEGVGEGVPAVASEASAEDSPDGLAPEERAMVEELRARDREVRAHELAHVGAAGGLAGAPSFSYQTGPDGKRYAIGGHVSIDTSPGRTHEETVAKAQRIRSAALAPAEPSGADRAVASRASQMESQARAALARQNAREAKAALEASTDAAEAANSEELSLPELPEVSLEGASSEIVQVEVDAVEPVEVAAPAVVEPPAQDNRVMTGGIALLATPRLAVFSGGSAADAQLYAGSERQQLAAYASASSLQSPARSPAMRLMAI